MNSPIRNIIKCARNHIQPNITAYDDIPDKLKVMIRKRLWDYQQGVCVYCRRKIEEHKLKIIDEHIEHILPKSKYPEVQLSAYNLALACSACNYNKGQNNIIGTVQISMLGISFEKLYEEDFLKNKNNKFYNIIHPYYDDYNDNIEIESFIYKVKQNAPNKTGAFNMIKICKLAEISAIEQRRYKEFQNQINLNLINQGQIDEKFISLLFKQ